MRTWESLLKQMEDLLLGERSKMKSFILVSRMEANALRPWEKILKNYINSEEFDKLVKNLMKFNY